MNCSLTAKQAYERWEKLPIDRRKQVASWVSGIRREQRDLLRFPSEETDAPGRPEKWRIKTVDTTRWNVFTWRPLIYYCVLSSQVSTAEQLFRSSLQRLDFNLFPLQVMAQRYECSVQLVCVEVADLRLGVLKNFVRSQREQTARQLKEFRFTDETDALEQEVRQQWKDEGLSEEQYRTFALKMFQIRAEDDPPFIFCCCANGANVVIWFRDVILAQGDFYRALLPGVEHIGWTNYTHNAEADPPYVRCERPDCINTDGVVDDESLLEPFVQHRGPYKRGVKEAKRERWIQHFQPMLDKEMEGKGKEEQAILIAKYEEMLASEERDERPREFKRCGRCKDCRYCSAECQRADWPRHKPFCYNE